MAVCNVRTKSPVYLEPTSWTVQFSERDVTEALSVCICDEYETTL